MKKFLMTTALVVLLSISIIPISACKDTGIPVEYTYEPSDEYFNIYATLVGNGASTRAFNFFTSVDEKYLNACSVQLDPAKKSEIEPEFNSADNFILAAKSGDVASSLADYSLNINEVVLGLLETAFPEGLRHKAEAKGLAAGQKYFYRVGSKSLDTWSAWGSFTTDDGDSSFSFMHITDSQPKDKVEFDALEKTLGAALNHCGVPEFLLSTGDQIENFWFAKEWTMLNQSLKATLSQTSLVPVNGNHEAMPFATAYNFNAPLQNDGYVYYSFDYGNALFAVLDIQDIVSDKSKFWDKPQFVWLEETLKSSTKKWKIVSLHKSLYSVGAAATDKEIVALKKELTPLLSKYGVDLVLSGHDHVYARTVPVNGLGEAGGQREYSNEILDSGVVKHTYTDAAGSVYVSNRSVGYRFYGSIRNENKHLLAAYDKEKADKPVFSKVDIVNGILTYTAYEHNRETGEIIILDCFALNKP